MERNFLIADFHVHSKFSRACSKDLTLPNIAATCERKGIDLVATSDFTHPKWMEHMREELEEVAPGIYALTGNRSCTRFLLVTEISSIYTQGGKVRRIHVLIFSPSIQIAEKFNAELVNRGCNLKSDGRPIVGLSAKLLLKIMLDISPDMIMVPAHAWTPWFSVFGSKSGFDSLEECFEELTPHIHAIETGLSSDPPMNWKLSMLDDITLISNSDAHSPEKLGREATVFNIAPNSKYTYTDIIAGIQNNRSGIIRETIEFFPEEGKYHVDGHAACNFYCLPAQTKKINGICPKCGKKLTIGVLYRVEELADRNDEKVIHTSHIPCRHIIPLIELIAHTYDVGVASKKVKLMYDEMIQKIGNEFYILLNAPLSEISANSSEEIASAIADTRVEKVKIIPGYDGVFGKISAMKKVLLEQKKIK